jgi:hypothetical protein
MRFPCFEAYFLEVTWHWRTYLILMQHISLFFSRNYFIKWYSLLCHTIRKKIIGYHLKNKS